jgi:hypothetical protein
MELEMKIIHESSNAGIWSDKQQRNIDWWAVYLTKIGPIYAIISREDKTNGPEDSLWTFYDNLEEAKAVYKSLI